MRNTYNLVAHALSACIAWLKTFQVTYQHLGFRDAQLAQAGSAATAETLHNALFFIAQIVLSKQRLNARDL